MTIDILCKVVDNYGDIGVAFRLARALSELADPPDLRIVVDDLAAFSDLDPTVDATKSYQTLHGLEIVSWHPPLASEALKSYRSVPPRAVIECFACGRPDWLEELLFAPEAEASLIVDLEHLTAESYAKELHRMPSLTRSAKVRKVMFLPGFEEGTGGLLLDAAFLGLRGRAADVDGRIALRRELLGYLAARGTTGEASSTEVQPLVNAISTHIEAGLDRAFWAMVFGYERDYSRIVADFAAFARARPIDEDNTEIQGQSDLLVLVAAGKSEACFLDAWEDAGRPFQALALPFLPQQTWDAALLCCDFSIVRGEDSWARAALSGRPFLWQAYPQDERQQLIKVEAFLGLLRRNAQAGSPLDALYSLYHAFNDRTLDLPSTLGTESLLPVLEGIAELRPAFEALARRAENVGNLAAKLVDFLGAAASPPSATP